MKIVISKHNIVKALNHFNYHSNDILVHIEHSMSNYEIEAVLRYWLDIRKIVNPIFLEYKYGPNDLCANQFTKIESLEYRYSYHKRELTIKITVK